MPNTSLENKAPALSDTHLQNIISELEAELDIARERQRDLDETRSRIEQLNLQLQQAKRETEEARNAIDILRVEEARVQAELEVTKTQQAKAEQETGSLRPVIAEFRKEVEQTRLMLQDARHKLSTAKALRDAEKAEIDKVKQALYAGVALEAQIQAEIEDARLSAQRDRQQTEEIQGRLQKLQEESERLQSTASLAQAELKNLRITESKVQVSDEGLPDVPITGESQESTGLTSNGERKQAGESATSLSGSASRLAMLKQFLPDGNRKAESSQPELPSRLFKQPKLEIIESKNSTLKSETVTQEEGIDEKPMARLEEQEKASLVKTDQVEVESTRNTDKLSSAKEKIYELADQGKDVTEISHLVNITQGEAELLLRMRNFKIDQ